MRCVDAIEIEALGIVLMHALLLPTLALAAMSFACGWVVGWLGDF